MTDPSFLRRVLGHPGARRFVTFFGASAIGLTIDLGLFSLLTWLGVEVWLSNGLSATISITAVYIVATRHTFDVRPRLSTYVAFVTWYASSIVAFSYLIDLGADLTELPPIIVKLASVPVSFLLNFAFSSVLFGRFGTGRDQRRAASE